jgi:hypothetical protein
VSAFGEQLFDVWTLYLQQGPRPRPGQDPGPTSKSAGEEPDNCHDPSVVDGVDLQPEVVVDARSLLDHRFPGAPQCLSWQTGTFTHPDPDTPHDSCRARARCVDHAHHASSERTRFDQAQRDLVLHILEQAISGAERQRINQQSHLIH